MAQLLMRSNDELSCRAEAGCSISFKQAVEIDSVGLYAVSSNDMLCGAVLTKIQKTEEKSYLSQKRVFAFEITSH